MHLRLLPYFDTREACALRLVCREIRSAVAAHLWQDRKTVILGSIGGWRACFPRARCANVRERDWDWGRACRRAPVVDADFVHFVGGHSGGKTDTWGLIHAGGRTEGPARGRPYRVAMGLSSDWAQP